MDPRRAGRVAPCGRDPRPPVSAATGWAVKRSNWLLWGIQELARTSWGAERRFNFP